MATTITFDSSVTAATEPSGSGSTSHYFNWANIINNVHQNSTINASKQVWYRVSRNSGSVGSGELGYTSGWEALTQIGTTNNYTFDVDVLIDDDAVDETARQGESFTLSIYSHSSQYQLIGSVNFTLYDADFSASSISAASQTIASNATSASVTLTQSQTPEAANPNMFVYNTSTLTGWYPSVGFGTSTTQSLTLPSTMLPPAGSTSNYIIRLYNGTAWYLQQPWNFSITRQAQSIVAPAISSVTHNNAYLPNVTATINLSSSGSGGTLKYAQSPSYIIPATGWQTSNTLSHPRGTTKYYWASRDERTSGTYGNSVTLAVGYVFADVSTTPSDLTIASTATSATVSLTGTTQWETYAVRAVNGSTNFATAQATTASGVSIGPFTNNIPSAGSSTTYEIFALRPTSIGGDGSSYIDTNDQFTVTKQAASGGGGSGGGSLSSATYGAAVYNNSSQQIWGSNVRSTNIGGSGSFSVSAGSYAHVTVEDMTTTNTDVLDVILVGPSAAYFWTSRGPGYYSIQNPYGSGGPTLTGNYIVVRYG